MSAHVKHALRPQTVEASIPSSPILIAFWMVAFMMSGCGAGAAISNGDGAAGEADSTEDSADSDADVGTDEGVAIDLDGDGFPASVDCDDTDRLVYPGATEVCGDGIDNDCSGADAPCVACASGFIPASGCVCESQQRLEGYCCEGAYQQTPCPSLLDADGDGYDSEVDCNDDNRSIHPGARQTCGIGVDQDCDPSNDECIPCVEGTLVAPRGCKCGDVPATRGYCCGGIWQTFPCNPAAKTCAEIQHPNCVEVWPGEQRAGYEFSASHRAYFFRDLSDKDAYFLLMGDIECDATCAVFGFQRSVPNREALTTFDLNGYTLRYSASDYATVNNNGFEEWQNGQPVGWTVVSGTVEERSTEYWMPMHGKSVLYTPGALVIESSAVHVPRARAYRAYVTVGRAAETPIVLEVVDGAGSVVCSEAKDGYFRGQSFACRFNAPGPGDYRLRLTTQGMAYLDRTGLVPLGDFGVAVIQGWVLNPSSSSHWPIVENLAGLSIPPSADAANPGVLNHLEIKNGRILAAHENQESIGVLVSGTTRVHLHDAVVIADGLKSHTLRGSGDIHDNHLRANMPWYFARENSDEENVIIGTSSFRDNVAVGGQGVIRLGGIGTEVSYNYLRNDAQATNHYAIIHSGVENPSIHDNVFDPIEGSGILTYVGHGYQIFGNIFNVKTATCNVEYIDEDYSTNAIRMNDYGASKSNDNHVFQNTFRITGQKFDTAWSNCVPVTTGIFYSNNGTGNRIWNNQFYVTKTFPEDFPVIALYLGGDAYNTPVDNPLIRGNVFESNDAAVWMSTFYGPTRNMWFEGNTFRRVPNPFYEPPAPTAPIRLGCTRASSSENIRFINNFYEGGYERDAISFTGAHQSSRYDLEAKWYLHVEVREPDGSPAAGAYVSANASGADESLFAQTDESGGAVLVLTAYVESGDMRPSGVHERTPITPHAITVEHDGFVFASPVYDVSGESFLEVELGGPCPLSGEQRACGLSNGACMAGVETCGPTGRWGPCAGVVMPVAESCNAEDDDCDGVVDESLGTTTCGVGRCLHTVDNCQSGVPTTCDPFEGRLVEDDVTRCDDRVDDDCDGADAVCATRFALLPADQTSGGSAQTFSCDVTDRWGVSEVILVTNEGGPMAEVDRRAFLPHAYHFLEAEDFSYQVADWDVCPNSATDLPGNSCEDDRTTATNRASGGAHVVSDDAIASGGTTDLERSITLSAGTYAVWGRAFAQANAVNRTWRVEATGYASSVFGGLTSGGWVWERSSTDWSLSAEGTHTLRIVDAHPDGYWAYADIVLVTDDLSFDPRVACGADLATGGPRYSLASCGLAQLHRVVTFSRNVSGVFDWQCRAVNGIGEVVDSPKHRYTTQ